MKGMQTAYGGWLFKINEMIRSLPKQQDSSRDSPLLKERFQDSAHAHESKYAFCWPLPEKILSITQLSAPLP